jgi:purine catabolism regulator
MEPSFSNLKDLIRLTFSEPVFWLKGEPGDDQSVNWAVFSSDDVQPGDLLVLPVEAVNQEVLIQADTGGVVAIVLLGEVGILPEELLDDINILVAHSKQDKRLTQRRLLTALIDQRALLEEHRVRVHAQLSQLAADGGGLIELAGAMADISGHGILVQDKRGRILAEYPCAALQVIWDDVLAQLSPLSSLPVSFLDRKLAGVQTGMVTQEIPGNLVRLVSPITVSEVVRGYLSLVGISAELDALDHLVVEQGVLVCAIEMSRKKAVREAEKRLKGDLLTALLQNDLAPRDAELWVQAMGLDLDQDHVALRFVWDESNGPSRRRLETIVNGEVARLDLKVIVHQMAAEIICFCQIPPDMGRPESALSLGQTVIDLGMREYPDFPLRCGVGTSAGELSEWRDSFRRAGQALALARRFKGPKPLYYPDLSVYRLLMQIEHNPELIGFQEQTLGPLLSHENHGEFVRTLEAYFENNGNLSQTAETLYIHRNTLLYRMERIAAILKFDLDNPDHRFAVQLALRIYRMKGPS